MKKKEVMQADKKYHMNVYGDRIPVVAKKGQGVYLYDKDGTEYLDFTAGIAVNALGYNHPQVTKAIQKQAENILHASNLYYFEIQSKLSKLLVENSCANKVFFANSGAEANEGAIKLARKYFTKQSKDKYKIIATKDSFHGRTLATLAATGQEKYQKPFTPLPQGFDFAPYNDLEAVKDLIDEKTAAIIVEPIQGEGGVNPATKEYLQGLRELCDQKEILLIFDEVQTGVGRTGSLFAYQEYGVKPDIFTLAKALGNGMPISSILACGDVAEAFEPGDHASTFGGNPLACRAAYATLKIILEENIIDQVKEVANYFQTELAKLEDKYAIIKDVRGKGLMIGVELRVSVKQIIKQVREENILILNAGENVLRFLPPLIINKDHVTKLIETLDQILSELD
ncbi:acetylornithine/succinylornithine aminotransferase [Halobacteroides halobius DSM 5150]|uniref:Acetylornithine aminotransferase n=1 Tax=Halobacteroides halobius (strain ATCC 35273 / DSM 5150 / MD-1) TaxID=748449 RepID=L0K8P2_HALHC|nr:aspartate aminotransferase family protein [Halobacteroides halobius]AGB40729.1 acetylornithine/succinylornithine aminotransferase [Halobacteroides halobius DSM 5150]